MKRTINIILAINSFFSFAIGYITFWFIDKDEIANKMITFEWRYLIAGMILALFTFFLIWSIRKIIIISVKQTIIHTEEQRWIFIRDTIFEKVYGERIEDFFKDLVIEVNGRKELKYDDVFLESLGFDQSEMKQLHDFVGFGNALPEVIKSIFSKFTEKSK